MHWPQSNTESKSPKQRCTVNPFTLAIWCFYMKRVQTDSGYYSFIKTPTETVLGLTGSLLSENRTEEHSTSIQHFVPCVSRCLLQWGGGWWWRQTEMERWAQRRDRSFFPSFFPPLLFIAAEVQSVICWAITRAEMNEDVWLHVAKWICLCQSMLCWCVWSLLSIFSSLKNKWILS